ncbi:MAG: radical SAM protein [Candidatus Aminicenantes bacterium]|nr:radical SAM protein [Candidatus Aminicenantes bacterium]
MKGNTAEKICPGVGQEELSIEVTTRCNGSCLHCFARSGISRHSSLPVDLVKEIMVEGYDAGYRHLHITGGEPLLWKGLFESLDYGFGVGFETIFMNTNGTLITEEISKRLGEYDSFSMSVSLDGPEDLHDRIRGKGSYKRTMRGIEKVINEGIDLTIFTTVTKSLLPELPHFVNDLYNEFPAVDRLILIQLISITKGPFALAEELLDPEDFIRLVRMVALLNVIGLRTVVKKNPVANIVSKLLQMPCIPRVPSLYREGCMFILANRNIGVVHSKRKSFSRYRAGMIRKVLASEGYRRTVAPDQATCPSCKYAQLCKENGMIRPSQGYGDLYADTPYCRQVLDRVVSDQAALAVNPDGRKACVC